MNLFNKSVRKASYNSLSLKIKKDNKHKFKCFYCKGDINKDSEYYQEDNNGGLYHAKCLTCHQCKKGCASEFYFTFKKINNRYIPTIYCKKDMNETCHECGEVIEKGGLVTFLGKKYHEDHFRCCRCEEVLSESEQVFEFNKKLFCSRDFVLEYRNEQKNQRTFLESRQPEESDVSEEESDEEDFRVVKDYKSNDYTANFYCGGCGTMLLAGSSTKEIVSRNEYWHLDCYLMFKRYKVILSPKFIDPRRYIMFSKDSKSINLTTELRNVSQWLNLYFEKLETEFSEVSKATHAADWDGLCRRLGHILSLISLLFKALKDVDFAISDYDAKIKNYSVNAPESGMERFNFSKYKILGDKHIRIYNSYSKLLKSGFSTYDINEFYSHILKLVDYLVGFSLHRILIYNYLTKQKQLLSLFLSKINIDHTDIDLELDDEAMVCSQCLQEIHLQPYVLRIGEDNSLKCHSYCADHIDISPNVPVLVDAYGDNSFSRDLDHHFEYVSAFDLVIDSSKKAIRDWRDAALVTGLQRSETVA